MNSAAKILQQHDINTRPLSVLRLANTPYHWLIHAFLLFVLLSALATIMITSKTRHDYRELQATEYERHEAELRQGRLLLEESTLLSHARVAQVANKIAMEMPAQKMLVVVAK